jgi:hypothetical protein
MKLPAWIIARCLRYAVRKQYLAHITVLTRKIPKRLRATDLISSSLMHREESPARLLIRLVFDSDDVYSSARGNEWPGTYPRLPCVLQACISPVGSSGELRELPRSSFSRHLSTGREASAWTSSALLLRCFFPTFAILQQQSLIAAGSRPVVTDSVRGKLPGIIK